MLLTSPAFVAGTTLPQRFTCYGAGAPVPLTIAGVPKQAKSLALIVDDPDTPAGTFVHWVVWNIPAATSEIAAGLPLPGASEGISTLGKPGWVAPCPPAATGTHRYFFKLYALDTELKLPPATNKQKLETAMAGHIIAEAQLMGVYTR